MFIKFIIEVIKIHLILLEWSLLMQAVGRRKSLFSKNFDVPEGVVTSSQLVWKVACVLLSVASSNT